MDHETSELGSEPSGDSGAVGGMPSDGGSVDNLIIIDPTSGTRNSSGDGAGNHGGSGTGRRRGRPPGSGNKTASGKTALDGFDIRTILISIHALLAVKVGEEWALEDDEAKQVESAIKRVMRHQDMMVSQKQLDYAFAAYVVAMVYGTRVATTVMGKTAKKTEPEPAPVNVTPFPGNFGFPPGGMAPSA